jgi:hypothetical protein
MDTSETYIRMCEKATEVQNTQHYEGCNGDYKCLNNACFAITKDNRYYYDSTFTETYVFNHTVKGYIRKPSNHFGCAVRDDLPIVYLPNEVVWLPRQDDLQGIVRGNMSNTPHELKHMHLLAHEFALFFHGGEEFGIRYAGHDIGADEDNSMEQMWLCYVMYKLYNKKWNGTEWEQIK